MTRPEIGAALSAIRGRQPDYAQAREYIAGEQRDVFETRLWEKEMGKRIDQPRDNITRTIIETLVSRLRPNSFAPLFPKMAGSQRHADTANAAFARNRMDEQVPETFRTAATCGDAYLLVHEIQGRAVITRQKPEQCHVEYDPEFPGRVLWGAKWWMDGKRVRLNIYRPEALYRFVTNAADWSSERMPTLDRAFQPFDEDGRPVQPNPTGIVPIFHFPNGAPTGEFGRSELAGLYPLFDHINSGLCDLVLAMRSVGYPWRFISGAKDESATDNYGPALGASLQPVLGGEEPAEPVGEAALMDPSNYLEQDGIDGGPGKLILLENDAARPHQLSASTLDGPIKFLDTLRAAVARNSRRPLHSLGLSEGVATATEIRVSEAVFLAEVQARQVTWGNVLENLASYCVLVETSHNATGFTGGGALADLTLGWEPAELTVAPTETELLTAAIDARMPFEDLLVRFFGYDADAAAEVAARQAVGDALRAEAEASRFSAGLVE